MSRAQAGGTLYIVGTPIGNLGDITIRAVQVLGSVSIIAAEDTRVTAKLLARHSIRTPLMSFREQNAARVTPRIIERLISGDAVALVSDAGTPGISDPGVGLVRAAIAAELNVVPIPGPSAVTAAISVCCFEGEGFRFVGFLPRRGAARQRVLDTISRDPAQTVIYESPNRLSATLADLGSACGPNRQTAVFRELTKRFEEIARGSLAELQARFEDGARGEITIVVAGNAASSKTLVDESELDDLIGAELAQGRSVKDVAGGLSVALGLPRRRIYERAIALRSRDTARD